MKKNQTIGISISILLNLIPVYSQYPLIININERNSISLNGKWKSIIDPYENGYYNYRYEPFDEMEASSGGYFLDYKPKDKTELVEYDFDKSPELSVPGDWNTQDEKLLYYEGTIWYRKHFTGNNVGNKERQFIYFGSANYRADVYLNGKKLGTHIGGFTPFNFEITEFVKEATNSLIVKVDNKRIREGVPTLNTDWWNYGGLTRDVKLVTVPLTFIRDYKIQLNNDNPKEIKGFVQLDGEWKGNRKIKITVPEISAEITITTDINGYAPFSSSAKGIDLWSPENPKLYKVFVTTNEDTVTDRIGFRTISTEGKDILLNGKEIFLKGISIHEENPFRSNRAYSAEDAQLLLGWVKELNGNCARLAHYPHNEYMSGTADELGILLWEEIPVYWTIDWDNRETFDNATVQLTEMISRDKNRASVIIWSVGNETPVQENRTKFMTELISIARKNDNTRLISCALEQHGLMEDNNTRIISDPLADYVDILSFNEYIGWYDGLPGKCSEITWEINRDKPVFISEFGADALYGFHADSLTRFSEEYQEYFYRQSLEMLAKIPQLRGMSPWILTDFRSPRRPLPGIQDGFNRKGLISSKGEKKKAFFVLQNFYKTYK